MQVQFQSDSTASHSGLKSREMNIDADKKAKLFTILSDGLYANKIDSVIREICSNAHDSHVMKGNVDVPFHMKAPSWEDMFFEVRDYGVGLTDEEAWRTILSFLGSEKDCSDEFIGGWGLGSKSPYAYGSSYEIITYKNGHRWVFNCWKDPNGLPQVAEFESGPTDEPDGVKVRVPVREEDVVKFRNSCLSYARKTEFNLEVVNHVVDKAEVLHRLSYRGYDYGITRHSTGGLWIMYGGYLYSTGDIQGLEADTKLALDTLGELMSYSLVLYVKVGQCDFSVSRESLRGTAKTIDFITKAVDALVDYMGEQAMAYQNDVIKPVTDHVQAIKANKGSLRLSDISLAINAEVSSIFRFVSYRSYIEKLAKEHVRDAHRSYCGDKNHDSLFSVSIELPTGIKRVLSNGKSFDSDTGFRQMAVVRRRNSYFDSDYSAKFSTSPITRLSFDITRPAEQQYEFLWSDERLFGKYVDAIAESKTVYIIEAPTEQEALSIYAELGLIFDSVQRFGDAYTYDDQQQRAKRPASARRDFPKYIVDYHSGTRYDYYADDKYVYYLADDSITSEQIRGYKHAAKDTLQFFCASPNFVKKKLKKVDNVIHYSELEELEMLKPVAGMIERYSKIEQVVRVRECFQELSNNFDLLVAAGAGSAMLKKVSAILSLIGIESWGWHEYFVDLAKSAAHVGNLDDLEAAIKVCGAEIPEPVPFPANFDVVAATIEDSLSQTALQYLNWSSILSKSVGELDSLRPLVDAALGVRNV